MLDISTYFELVINPISLKRTLGKKVLELIFIIEIVNLEILIVSEIFILLKKFRKKNLIEVTKIGFLTFEPHFHLILCKFASFWFDRTPVEEIIN